jgi:hypothetical protein
LKFEIVTYVRPAFRIARHDTITAQQDLSRDSETEV